MEIKAILFDLDGTLAETAGDLCAAMNKVFAQYNVPQVEEAHIREMIGGGARAIIERGLAHNGKVWSDKLLTERTEEMVTYYEQSIAKHSYLYDGIEPFLNEMHGKIKMAVVTNKREQLAEKLLTALGVRNYFDTLIGGDTLPKRKPHPLPIIEALTRLNVKNTQTLMIGDTQDDTKAAQAAGVKTIIMRQGYSHQNPTTLGANMVLDDYSGLKQALAKFMQ